MIFYKLKPEVPGHFGEETELNQIGKTFVVENLHYVIDGWQGDDIITTKRQPAKTRHNRLLV